MDHTKEPWSIVIRRSAIADTGDYFEVIDIVDAAGKSVRFEDADNEQHEANARRIVACVNACDGINTTQLEMASPFDLALHYKKEANSLRAALAEKTAQVERLREAIDDWGCKHDHPSIFAEIDEALAATAPKEDSDA